MTFTKQWVYTENALHEINESIKKEFSHDERKPMTEEEIRFALEHWDDFCNQQPTVDIL